jgi:hypothetical protein
MKQKTPTDKEEIRKLHYYRLARTRLLLNGRKCDACGHIGYWGKFEHVRKMGQFREVVCACGKKITVPIQ